MPGVLLGGKQIGINHQRIQGGNTMLDRRHEKGTMVKIGNGKRLTFKTVGKVDEWVVSSSGDCVKIDIASLDSNHTYSVKLTPEYMERLIKHYKANCTQGK